MHAWKVSISRFQNGIVHCLFTHLLLNSLEPLFLLLLIRTCILKAIKQRGNETTDSSTKSLHCFWKRCLMSFGSYSSHRRLMEFLVRTFVHMKTPWPSRFHCFKKRCLKRLNWCCSHRGLERFLVRVFAQRKSQRTRSWNNDRNDAQQDESTRLLAPHRTYVLELHSVQTATNRVIN